MYSHFTKTTTHLKSELTTPTYDLLQSNFIVITDRIEEKTITLQLFINKYKSNCNQKKIYIKMSK